MKAYCECCDDIAPASFRPGNDAKTGAPFEDLCCDQCHLVIATVCERTAETVPVAVDESGRAIRAAAGEPACPLCDTKPGQEHALACPRHPSDPMQVRTAAATPE